MTLSIIDGTIIQRDEKVVSIDEFVALVEKKGWVVAEVAQLRWELWGRMDLPDGFRSELDLPRTVKEGVEMLIEEDWGNAAMEYLLKPPYRIKE